MIATPRAARLAALWRSAAACAVLLPLLAACKDEAPAAPPYQPVGPAGAAVREAFNAAAGAPRVVVLLAPT